MISVIAPVAVVVFIRFVISVCVYVGAMAKLCGSLE